MTHAAQNSPLPWHLRGYVNYDGFAIYAKEGGCVCERWDSALSRAEMEANAALIIRAVNSLDSSIAAMEAALGALTEFGLCWPGVSANVKAQLRAAIKLAKGGSDA